MKLSHINYEGKDAIELTTRALRLVAVHEYGPRIAFLGKPKGENLLLWAPGKYGRNKWDLGGGHRVWIARPGADECEETYAPDNGVCEVAEHKNGFRLTSAEDKTNCTRRGMDVKVLDDDMLQMDNFVTNTGDMLFSGSVWALTCTVPQKGTLYGVPIGDNSKWDCFNMVFFKWWGGGHTGLYNDPAVTIKNNVIVVDPKGSENKRMIQADAGIIAMSDVARKVTFAKKVKYDPAAKYPLGCNIAFYTGPKRFMVEMETMGAEVTLKPGETAHNVETWVLKPGAVKMEKGETLKKLFRG